MALLDSLQNLGTNIGNLFRPANKPGEPGVGIAQMSVPWEVTTPQYPLVNPYALTMTGYGRNELVYTCITKRMDSVSEAPLREWDGEINAKTSKMLENTGVIELLRKPNDIMGESDFWAGTSLYKDVGGFAAWEKQYNRRGEVIALYPMRPDWCSFRRGPDRLRAILRYQPAGLPFVDVPVERCVIIMDPHPLWMGIRPVSKSMVAMRITASDNAATDFITSFMQNGAVINGLLSVVGSLQNTEADRLRDRWQETHSGENKGKIAVLGNGSTFQKIQMDFKEMDFTNLDGRDEARICAIFGVSPILIGAKLGLTGSTFSNYKEARSAYYDETITPLWKHFATMIERQLLPDFLATEKKHYLGFDLSDVRALQEDVSATWTRSMEAAKANIITRDEARAEIKLDPIDNEDVFIGMTIRSQSVAPIEADPNLAQIDAQDQAALGAGKQPPAQQPQPKQLAQATTDATTKALTAWRKAALANVGAGVGAPFDDELKAAKTKSDVRAIFDKHWREQPQVDILPALLAEIRLAREELEAHG